MHTLVRTVLTLFSISTWAKHPPDISQSAGELIRVVGTVSEIDQRFKNLNDSIQRTMEVVCDTKSFGNKISKCEYTADLKKLTLRQSCVSTNESRTKRVATCVLAIEENLNQLRQWIDSASSVLKEIDPIRPEFNLTKETIKAHLMQEVNWALENRGKLVGQADRYFSINKKIIEKEFDLQMNDLKNQVRAKAICSNFDKNLKINQLFAKYYETVEADLPTYDQLRYQVARELWRMEFLKEKCHSEAALESTKNLFDFLNQKVNGESFNKYKAEICRNNDESKLLSDDCFTLPQTPDALATLSSLKNKKGETR